VDVTRWSAYFALGSALIALYVAPGPFHGRQAMIVLLGASSLAAAIYAIVSYRPVARNGWWLLVGALSLLIAGDAAGDGPGRDLADGFYLAMYPVAIAGLAVFVRRRRRESIAHSRIDGLILTIGLALPGWVLLGAPHLDDPAGDLDPLATFVFPAGDILLLAGAIQLALGRGRRNQSLRLLLAGLTALLVFDFCESALNLGHGERVWLDAGWMASYVLWGAAALHPSMVRLGAPATGGDEVLLTPTRIALLTGAALVAPVISAAQHLSAGNLDFLVVDLASLSVFTLVLLRMIGLARRQRTLSREIYRLRGEERFAALVRHASDLIAVLSPDGAIQYASPSVLRLLGEAPSGRVISAGDRVRVERAFAAVLAGDEVGPLECTITDRDGQPRVFEMRFTNLIDEEHVGGILVNGHDVSERKAFEAELAHQAFHDPVTGLANRALFVERTRDAIVRSHRTGASLAVLFGDLDDFKTINDSLGHAAGDEVLQEVARRLDVGMRATDRAARFGGDEFAILLEGAGSQGAADAAQRVLNALGTPFQVAGRAVTLRASLGISVAVPGDTRTAEELIRDADAAMYVAKRDGKNRYRLFEPAMHASVLARLELRTDLQRAIDAGELELHYQPVVRLADGSTAGFEALMRWRHPERGLISPAEFIPIAEETGLIVPMGRWAMHEAAAHLRALGGGYRMNVNLSAAQLHDPRLVEDVRAAIADIDPAQFVLELTESMVMQDADQAVARLAELKGLGIRLALDDFGTGHSSLGYLSRLPVDILKLDRAFLTGDEPNLIAAVVGLGQALELDVVAEGIEEDGQWQALCALGCHYGQGFLFSRPLDAAASLAHVG